MSLPTQGRAQPQLLFQQGQFPETGYYFGLVMNSELRPEILTLNTIALRPGLRVINNSVRLNKEYLNLHMFKTRCVYRNLSGL